MTPRSRQTARRPSASTDDTVPGHDPRLSYVIGRLDRAVRRELQDRLQPFGLKVPEYTALSVLRSRPGLSNAQLARRALITPQSMSEITVALERKGLVERDPDPAHNRILRAHLTAEGQRVLDDCDERVDDMEREMLSGLSPTERRRLLENMRHCVRHLGAGL
jgi:DNA-binding MarR family transcriptional regulator